jgi:DNA polymerase-1
MKHIAFDYETYLVSGENLIPKPVCLTAADDGTNGVIEAGDDMLPLVEAILDSDDTIVAHFAAFDVSVMLEQAPERRSLIWQYLSEGRFECTLLREKLLDLHEYGKIGFRQMPDDSWVQVRYGLAALVKNYLGIDISEGKQGDDAWRMNYDALDGIPIEDWPAEAISYAVDDSTLTHRLYEAQEARRLAVAKECGVDPLETAGFRTAVSVALYQMTARGIAVDPEERERIVEWVEGAQAPENFPALVDGGYLLPGTPPRPYANGAKDADGNPKMTKGTNQKVVTKMLKEHVAKVCEESGVEPLLSEKTGQPSLKAEWLEENYGLSDVLTQYHERQKLEKLRTTEIPRISQADIVHPRYDPLKVTGRTGSSSVDDYPSLNIQNVDPRVRPVFVPRPGFVLFSIDYSQLELVTAAQQIYRITGKSVLRDKINAGVDTHAFLGAQLAYAFDKDFREECDRGGADTKEDRYEVFLAMRRADAKAFRFYGHYRKLAKPTGLGYPGGLGSSTFVAYCKASYGLVVTEQQAKDMRQVWFQTYPEFDDYFKWVNQQTDNRWSAPGEDRYVYTTPMGMRRPNCRFTEVANGYALQSPSAEAALTAAFRVVRAAKDPSLNSPLLGRCHPIGFIHDEILGELEDDVDFYQQGVDAISEIMLQSLHETAPDVKPRVEAVLMRRWYKQAEPVFDQDGRIGVWSPKENPHEH